MGVWTLSSGTFAAIAACLVLPRWRKPVATTGTPIAHLGRRLLIEGGTLCLLTAMMVLFQLVDSFTVKNGLVAGGASDLAAKSLKGIYDRAQPLVQLGLVVAVAFATSLLPALTEAQRQQRPLAFKRLTATMMRIALIIATAAAAGLISLMPWVDRLLFGDAQGATMLAIYMLSIVLATLIQTYNSVLQSQDGYRLTVVALLVGLAVKMVGNHWMVERFGGIGASWLTVAGLLVTLVVIWYGSAVELRSGVWTTGFLAKLIGCTGLMVISLRGLVGISETVWPRLTSGRLLDGAGLLVLIPVGALVFLAVALWWRLLTVREWLTLPFAKRLLRFWQRLGQIGGK